MKDHPKRTARHFRHVGLQVQTRSAIAAFFDRLASLFPFLTRVYTFQCFAASQFSIAVRVKPLPRDAAPNADVAPSAPKLVSFLALSPDTTQHAAYEHTVAPLVARIVGGTASSAVLLCYGQTGSGKTHTVFGPPASLTEASLHAQRTAALPVAGADADARLHASAYASVPASASATVPASASASASVSASVSASASASVSATASVSASASAPVAAPDSWGCFGRALIDLLNAPGFAQSALSVSAVEIYLDRVSRQV
jgi:hypothetical protein